MCEAAHAFFFVRARVGELIGAPSMTRADEKNPAT